jgi:peptidoglycan/xylan/chitin deacetylase (PgdA/CDA1 family)
MWPNPRIPFQMSNERARLEPLDGKPLMVNPVVNIEYWPFDRPMPRGILPPPHGAQIEPPDVPNYSWVEYGLRCGVPRLFEVMGQRGIRATAFINAQCADVYPSLAKATVDAAWELVGHGWFQRSLKQIEDEEGEVRKCLVRLEQLSGKKVRAWFGAGGGETMQTMAYVLKRCGIDFMHDWLLDDLPCWMVTAHGPLLCLPYTWELNDVPIWVVQGQSSDELLKRLEATLAVLEREIERQPRVLTLAMHPHILGVRIAPTTLKRLSICWRQRDTVFVTSSEIADWFLAADKTGLQHLETAVKARVAS